MENLGCTVDWTASTEDSKESNSEKWDCSCMMDCMLENLDCIEDLSVNTKIKNINISIEDKETYSWVRWSVLRTGW